MNTVKLSSIRVNPKNPRIIKDDAFRKLVDSIKRYPQFLDKRGIVHADGVILGGNMRYRAIADALKDAAFRARVGVAVGEIPAAWVMDASEWSEEDRQAFVIADNAAFGAWDWDILANEWDAGLLDSMCVFPELAEPPDFQPATEEEQGKLDQLDPKIVK